MPDYDLHHLSWRSFEQLVQALALKVISPGVSIFGDGPDGGREATFDGDTTYPSAAAPWRGYGVLQAKFMQVPTDSTRAGEWAHTQLVDELRAYEDGRSRRKPDFFIFATNVALTPYPGSGSLDRCNATLATAAEKMSWSGFDIWDYNRIRSYLDDARDIREAYGAWITPGDVLAALAASIADARPDFDRTLRLYLEKELLSDQYVNLEQAGHHTDDPIPIGRVFIDLPVQERHSTPYHDQDAPRFAAQFLQAASMNVSPAANRLSRSNPRPEPKSHGAPPGRFVLVGGPGQGKTTLGQYICQLYRVALLDGRTDLSPEAARAIQEVTQYCSTESLQMPIVRLPIRVVLSQFARYLSDTPGPASLLRYVAERIERRTDLSVEPGDLRRWLQPMPWCVVLDGLDEVPASTNRADVLEAVRDFLVDANECNSDMVVLATTRPQGYNADFSPDMYQHLFLAPLTPRRALDYARRLVATRWPGELDRRERLERRLLHATRDPGAVRLMQSPLQVTIMTTLVDRMGQPPNERWNLFNEYYNVIYQREMERDIPTATVLRDHKPDVDAIHRLMGLALQAASESSGGTDARTTVTQFRQLCRVRLEGEGHLSPRLEEITEAIVRCATQRLVFLAGVEDDRVGFEIRSLQEFMAAECLMDSGDDIVRTRLHEIAALPHWRNVFLFCAGKAYAQRQYFRETIHSLCAELDEAPDDLLLRDVKAGAQLALDLLVDGPAFRQPHSARVLLREAMLLLDADPPDGDAALAGFVNTESAGAFRDRLEIVLAADSPASDFAWRCALRLPRSVSEELFDTVTRLLPKAGDRLTALLASVNALFDSSCVGHGPALEQLQRGSGDEVFSLLESHLYDDRHNGGDDLGQACPAYVRFAASVLSAMMGPIRSIQIPGLVGDQVVDNLWLEVTSLEEIGTAETARNLLSKWPPELASVFWDAIRASLAFAADPSATSLARALRAFIENDRTAIYDFYFTRLGPWPSRVALLPSDEVAALADELANGRAGDLAQWVALEQRWRNEGLPLFGSSSAGQSAGLSLLTGAAVDAQVVSDRLRFPTGLGFASIARRAAQSSPLTAAMVLGMVHAQGGPDGEPDLSVADLVALLEAAASARSWLPSEVLIAADWSDVTVDVLKRVDLAIRNYTVYPSHTRESPSPAGVTSILCEYLSANPGSVGILRAVACLLLASPHTEPVPISIDPASYEDPTDEFSAWLLLVRSGSRDLRQSIAEIAQAVIRAAASLQTPMFDVLGIFDQRLSYADTATALVSIRRGVVDRQFRQHLHVVMVEALAQRQSRFSSVTGRSALGIPVVPVPDSAP